MPALPQVWNLMRGQLGRNAGLVEQNLNEKEKQIN